MSEMAGFGGRSAHFMVGAGRPIPQVQDAAARYRDQQGMGMSAQRDFSHVTVDPVVARHVASLYEQAPDFSHEALPSFRAMRDETMRQHDFMTSPRGLGLTHEVTPHDPYVNAQGGPDHAGMMRDVAQGRIKSMATATTGSHPFLSDDENDAFRAVHDVFGHAGTGRDFSRHGEEAAWQAHRTMFTPAARPALTTETRGQNSALNYGSNPGTFAPQKVALLGSGAQLVGRRSLHRALGRQFQPLAVA